MFKECCRDRSAPFFIAVSEGVWTSLSLTCNKLAFHAQIKELTSNVAVEYLIRGTLTLLTIYFNTQSLATYIRLLAVLSTLKATLLQFAFSTLFTGLVGLAFGEAITPLWGLGALCLTVGVAFLGSTPSQSQWKMNDLTAVPEKECDYTLEIVEI